MTRLCVRPRRWPVLRPQFSRDLDRYEVAAVNRFLAAKFADLRITRPREDVISKAERIILAGDAKKYSENALETVYAVRGDNDTYRVAVLKSNGSASCSCVNPRNCSHIYAAKMASGFGVRS